MYIRSMICLLILMTLSSCNLVHKADIEQGNMITADKVQQLHPGMTEAEVAEIMGNPVLKNIFSIHRVDYVYTLQKGHGRR
ncbi:MAG: outer membrane protein assembly factor BamE, partial [Gammaproteobacteria bacterium]|nr:outer membrane protein assembly factor BamE [Gammaproteobacteria bacterium]